MVCDAKRQCHMSHKYNKADGDMAHIVITHRALLMKPGDISYIKQINLTQPTGCINIYINKAFHKAVFFPVDFPAGKLTCPCKFKKHLIDLFIR